VIEWGWQASEVTQAWHQDCEAGGWHLQDSVAALLRHSAAVHMAEDRRSMEEIRQFLGHSDINVTRKIYARFSPDYLKEAAEALEIDDLGTLYRRTLPKADHQPLKH
jgi:integrase